MFDCYQSCQFIYSCGGYISLFFFLIFDLGYKAEVTYEGEAKVYDAPKPKNQPQPSSYKPVSTKKGTESGGRIGQVYYKPLKEAPNSKVYYKPLPETPSEVYYKPIEA